MSANKIQTLSAADNLEQLEQWAESYPKKQNSLTAGTGISISGSTISCTLDTDVFEVVTALPSSGIANKIYCVPISGETGEQNIYTEYLYINNSWEKIGEFHADVNLSNYYTKDEVYNRDQIEDIISDYSTTITLDKKFDEISTSIDNVQERLEEKQDKLVYYAEYDNYGLLHMTEANLRISDGEIIIDASCVTFFCQTQIKVDTQEDKFLYNNKPVATVEDIPSVVSAFDNDAGYITSAALDDYVTTDTLSSTLSSYAKKSIVPTKTSELTNDSGYITSNDIGGNIYIYNFHELATNSKISELQLFDMFCVTDEEELVELLSKINTDSSTLTIINTYGGEWDEISGFGGAGQDRVAWYAGSTVYDDYDADGYLAKRYTIYFITPDSSNMKDFTFYYIYLSYISSPELDRIYDFSWGKVS